MGDSSEIVKTCAGPCGRLLPLDEYNNHPFGKYGKQARCKDCKREENRKIRLADPTKAARASIKSKRKNPEKYRAIARKYATKNNRRQMLKHCYGLTLEQFDAANVAQGGRCKICGKIPEDGKPLHVDHCHKEGRVRGLLCGNCNRGIGIFQDDRYLLMKAIEYLS